MYRNYKNDMLNLLPALEKLGTNFEEITNDLFDVAQATEPDFVFISLFKKSHAKIVLFRFK